MKKKREQIRKRRRKENEEEEEGGGGVTDLTHAQLEGASLFLELLGDLSSAHLVPHHPILTSQLPLLLLHLLTTHTHTHTHTPGFYQGTPADIFRTF